MADETTPAAPPIPDSIPITDPTAPQSIPIDLNPEYDPAKDTRAPFLKINPNPKGPTISPAPDRSVGQVLKEAVTENIPQFSSRTSANPKYGKQSFLPDSDIMTAQQRKEAPALAGGLDVASELASPATVATVAATAGLGEAGVIPKVLSGLFAGRIAKSVYDQYPALSAAVDQAQHAKSKAEHDDAFADAQRILTHMGADTVMGLLAAKHGAEGAKEILDATTGSGVPDQASTFKAPKGEEAPTAAPEDVHPEYNRATVKELQKLGYSSQHITQFNITEIRDILKNQTPAVEYKFPNDNRQWSPNQPSSPAAPVSAGAETTPDPEKFAEVGGKLVGPAPKAASAEAPIKISTDRNGVKWAENADGIRVSVPQRIPEAQVQEYATQQIDTQAKMQAAIKAKTAAPDPIESLIMSDKIGGKKVRGAKPQTALEGTRWFHGTSDENSAKIQKAGKLIPGQDSEFDVDVPRKDAVYVTSDPEIAKTYAGQTGKVHEVQIDPSKLIPDEDAVVEALNHGRELESGAIHQGVPKGSEGVARRVQQFWLKEFNKDAKTEGLPTTKDFTRAWEELYNPSEGGGFEGPSQLAEDMKDMADRIAKQDPQLSKAIIQATGKAAHVGEAPLVRPSSEAFAEVGGKYVGKAPEPTAPTYHPDLQKVAEANSGVTESSEGLTRGASFITPDGKFIHLRAGMDHPEAISRATGDEFKFGDDDEHEGDDSETLGDTSPKTYDNRVNFINQTGAIRTRFKNDYAGPTIHISVPAGGVTADQIPAIQQAIAKAGRNGNVVMERADVTPETKDELTMSKEFPRAGDTEKYLRQIQAHPDQQVSIDKELQTPHKKTYGMEVTDSEGKSQTVQIEAHSAKRALAETVKKFPDASEWRLAVTPTETAPSTEYSVPTGKIQKMKASTNRPEIHTIRHELGHVFIGKKFGMTTQGMLSSSHPDMPSDARAGVAWDMAGRFAGGKLRPEALVATVYSGLGGIAADEVFNDLGRNLNPNFDYSDESGDGGRAYRYLLAEGMSRDEAMSFIHDAIDANVEYLKHPVVSGMMHENAGVREAGLSRQFHFSPERLDSIAAETNRRMQNAESTEKPDDGAINGRSDQDGETAHAGGEREGPQDAVGEPAETEEGIVDEEKIKKASKELPEVSPNEKLQASAQKYAAAHGMPEINHEPVEADPEHAKAVAQQYEDSKHAPDDPAVKASYDALKAETLAQFHHLRDDLGLKFKPQDEDPYNSAEEMMDDIKKKNQLKVFTGSSTGEDHALSEIAPKTGGQTYNTVFRWVHDAMGHAAGGNDFSESGEKSATEAHAQLYSAAARPAMRNETEGQTSWFFHNPEVESGKAQPGKFAEQKAALIHDETTAPAGRSFTPVTSEAHQAAVTANPHAVSLSDVNPEGKSYQMQVDGKPVPVFYSINPDGEISSVVNNSKGAVKSAATDVFKDAAEKGGKYLTAWDVNDKLPAIYRNQGFEVTGRVPYDEKTYGPPSKELQDSWKASGWKPGDKYPTVVRMEPISDHTVSTRVPTGKVKGKVVENHTDQSRMSDMDAAKTAPGYVQKMVNRTNETPGFTAPDATAQEQADAYIRHAADNIKFVNSKVTPEEFKRDSQWYPVGAHERGQAVAKQHSVTPHQAYAVTSVESPMTDWDQNTSLAERTINIWKNQQNTKFTPEMQEAADRITSIPANKSFKWEYKKLTGKTLGELTDIKEQAHWLRLYDEAHNPRDYETWGPDGKSLGFAKNQDGSNKKVGWSFQSHIQKAISILKDGSDENISKQLGYGHKVRNFYNNQLAPDDPRFLTMDTHAINVAQLRPMSGKTKAVRENFGTIKNGPFGLSGTYPAHDAAYRLAAKELDIPIPSRIQSPTWVKIRDVFTDDFKTPENQAAVDAIWKEHEDGQITADQARNRIWDYAVGWNRENAARTRPATDQGKLFEGGVHGESSGGPAGRGTGVGTAGEVPAPGVDDTSFDFGANVKPAASRVSKVSEAQRAKNDAKVAGIVAAMRGLDKPRKK